MKIVISIIIAILMTSCYPLIHIVPGEIQQSFTQKHTGERIDTENKIRFDGYYAVSRVIDEKKQEGYPTIMFFEDGTFIYNFSTYHMKDVKYIRNSTTAGTYRDTAICL